MDPMTIPAIAPAPSLVPPPPPPSCSMMVTVAVACRATIVGVFPVVLVGFNAASRSSAESWPKTGKAGFCSRGAIFFFFKDDNGM